MRKENRETIEIMEDVRVPGTDVILEAGDKIEVLKEGAYKKVSDLLPWLSQANMIKDLLLEAVEEDIEVKAIKVDYFKGSNSASIYFDLEYQDPEDVLQFLDGSNAWSMIVRTFKTNVPRNINSLRDLIAMEVKVL